MRMIARIVVAVLLPGLAAWSQDNPKAQISIDYSHVHFAAVDYETKNSEFYRAYGLDGGGGSVVFNFSHLFGIKGEFQGYASQTRQIVLPPGNKYIPQGAVANVPGNLFTYMVGPQIGKRYGGVHLYAHALVGGAHTNVYTQAWSGLNLTQSAPSPSSNAFAADAGAGLDIAVGRHFEIRPVEISYLYTDFKNPLTNGEHSWRYLAGVVYNIGHRR